MGSGPPLWEEPMACTTKQRRTRRTIVAVLGGALLLGATGLAAAGELAPLP